MLPYINGITVGQTPVVRMLIWGILIKDPPQPKYEFLWDINMVLKYLSNLPSNYELLLLQLGKMITTLLVLGAPEEYQRLLD